MPVHGRQVTTDNLQVFFQVMVLFFLYQICDREDPFYGRWSPKVRFYLSREIFFMYFHCIDTGP